VQENGSGGAPDNIRADFIRERVGNAVDQIRFGPAYFDRLAER
jgi:hypothetical protein